MGGSGAVAVRRAGWSRWARLGRFSLVGATGLAVNQFVLWFFTEHAHVHYLLSAAIATQCSTIWNFALTESWVFRATSTGRIKRLFWFAVMNNAWFAARAPMLYALTTWAHIHYLTSNLIVLGAMTVGRFLLADNWIWGPSTDSASRGFSYDVHSIVRLHSSARLPELEPFRVPELDRDPDIEVVISGSGFGGLRRRPLLAKMVSLESHSISFTYTEHLGRFGFAVRIDLGRPTRVQAARMLRFSPHVLYTNVIEPILRWEFVRRGYALAHGACLEFDGKGLLITAETDTGKTTTCLNSIRSYGAGFASDDMTILSPEGIALTYPKPMTISAHTLKAVRAADLPLHRKISLQVQGRVHSKSGRRFALFLARHNLPVATVNAVVQLIIPPPKYFVEQLIPDARRIASTQISNMVIIERGPELTEDLDLADACAVLMANTEDAYRFPPYHLIGAMLANGEAPLEAQIHRAAIERMRVTRIRTPDRRWSERLSAIVSGRPEDTVVALDDRLELVQPAAVVLEPDEPRILLHLDPAPLGEPLPENP